MPRYSNFSATTPKKISNLIRENAHIFCESPGKVNVIVVMASTDNDWQNGIRSLVLFMDMR